jgi:hypothetical protein
MRGVIFMKTIWKITILTFLSVGFLAGCNAAEKRDALNQENDVNFRPVRYERNTNGTNVNESNNDFKNQENRRNEFR